jgi:NAD(P)-dependent dehydrogenase (short-subunit alcohol dehydrogenase family)
MSNIERIALITGGNKGIGFEIASQLAAEGITVLIGARDASRGQEAVNALLTRGLNAQSIIVDLNEPSSITAAAQIIDQKYGRLDILINNAGITDPEDGAPTIATLSAVRRIMDTNFVGTLAVTQTLLPLLRAAPAARIVNLSSSLGSLPLNGDPTSEHYAVRLIGYNASKAALNMLTVHFAQEFIGTKIAINSVSPGYVKTDLNGNTGILTPEEGARLPVQYALLGENPVTGQFIEKSGNTPW